MGDGEALKTSCLRSFLRSAPISLTSRDHSERSKRQLGSVESSQALVLRLTVQLVERRLDLREA